MSTLKVSLADAPTDVLVHLVDNGPATVSELVLTVAPPDIISPVSTISYAIDLLRRIGYVRGHSEGTHQWAATLSGVEAVQAARADAATEPTP